jgi:hypothetical protein
MLYTDLSPFLSVLCVASCPSPTQLPISAFMARWLLSSQNSPVRQSDIAASHPAPCTLKCSFSGSPAATDHTDCSHHSLQTKVTSQKSPLLLGTSRNTAPGHRTTEIHKPGVTFFYKVLGSSVKAGRESFPVSPSLCLGVLGYTGLAPYTLSCEHSILQSALWDPCLGMGRALFPTEA